MDGGKAGSCFIRNFAKKKILSFKEVFQRKLFFPSKKFCKEKYSFLKTIFIKPRRYVISTSEIIFIGNIFLTEKPLGYVISTRETIIFLKYLFQQRYRYDKQP